MKRIWGPSGRGSSTIDDVYVVAGLKNLGDIGCLRFQLGGRGLLSLRLPRGRPWPISQPVTLSILQTARFLLEERKRPTSLEAGHSEVVSIDADIFVGS